MARHSSTWSPVASRRPDDTGAGLVYSRFNHPNLEIVEDRLALLDSAEDAIVTSSGMAAIGTVLLTFLRPGRPDRRTRRHCMAAPRH